MRRQLSSVVRKGLLGAVAVWSPLAGARGAEPVAPPGSPPPAPQAATTPPTQGEAIVASPASCTPASFTRDEETKVLEPSHHIRGAVAASFGYCVRDDATVGGTGICPEGVLGIQIPLGWRLAEDGWFAPRLDIELGIGTMPSVSQGNPDLPGVAYSAGGFYGVGRAMVGWDWPFRRADNTYAKTLFFTRLGVQSRLTYSMSFAAPGIQGVIDLGTRVVSNHIEGGFRSFLGPDGETVGSGHSRKLELSLAYGTQLYVRYLFP